MDHTPSDMIVADDATMLPLGRPTITSALDEHTRCPMGFYMGFEPPSCLSVMRCLKHARGDHAIDIGFFGSDEFAVNSSRRLNQAIAVFCNVPTAVKVFQLRLQIGEAWGEIQSEPVEDSEVGPVDAVHIPGDRGRRDVGGVVIADIEYVVTFVFVGADQFGL